MLIGALIVGFWLLILKKRAVASDVANPSSLDIYRSKVEIISSEYQDQSHAYTILSQALKYALSQLFSKNYMCMTNEEVVKCVTNDEKLTPDNERLIGFFNDCQGCLYQNQISSRETIRANQSLVLEYLNAAGGETRS